VSGERELDRQDAVAIGCGRAGIIDRQRQANAFEELAVEDLFWRIDAERFSARSVRLPRM